MATSTFEREITITDSKSVERLRKLMSNETPRKPISARPSTRENTIRSEAILKRCPLHSPH